ncbi:MAG TPA: CAAX prenyl protease-related protein [Vicinamibacterales bacterium]|nr:CAAX prenyl protease-related protein [Vicinamibacterales bacterium]
MVVFGALTMGEAYVAPEWFPAAYIAKAVIVTTTLLVFRSPLSDISFNPRVVLPSIVIGLVVFVVWVGLDRIIDYPRLGSRTSFNPQQLHGSAWWPSFLAARLYGLVLMVPVMEEIFWRSFLLRYLTRVDFTAIPVGTFSAMALWVMVAASAAAHPEWLAAVVASLAYALWLRRSRSLFGAIVAHAATNAALGGYVLATGEWHYW